MTETKMKKISYSICRPMKGASKSWWISVNEANQFCCQQHPIAYIHPSNFGRTKEGRRILEAILENLHG